MTQDLLARGLSPASHFSLNLHEPVKKLLDRYGAKKVFIEGDAIILAIFETEATRTYARAVAKACILVAADSDGVQHLQRTCGGERFAADRTGRGRRVPGLGADVLDGRGFAHHDFEGAESFRPACPVARNWRSAC